MIRLGLTVLFAPMLLATPAAAQPAVGVDAPRAASPDHKTIKRKTEMSDGRRAPPRAVSKAVARIVQGASLRYRDGKARLATRLKVQRVRTAGGKTLFAFE